MSGASVVSMRRRRAGMGGSPMGWATLALSALLLAGCARGPAPVVFHAEGYPARLSDWNVVYRDGDRLALNERVVPFDLNTPLFSDYAHKLRTMWLPEGTSARYEPREAFDFPVGTILSKTFFYPVAAGENGVARTDDTSRDHAGEGLEEIERKVKVRPAGAERGVPRAVMPGHRVDEGSVAVEETGVEGVVGRDVQGGPFGKGKSHGAASYRAGRPRAKEKGEAV